MAHYKKKIERDPLDILTERFNDALAQMSKLSVDYRDGNIKPVDYNQKLDSVIDASGWNKNDFYKEIQRRKLNFGI